MPGHSMNRKSFLRGAFRALFTFVLAGLVALPAARAADRSEACNQATSLTLNQTVHAYGSALGTIKIFAVTPPAAGALTLDAASPGDDPVQPKVTFYGTDCLEGGGEGSDYWVIETTPAGLVVQILTGSQPFYVQLEPEDPQGSLSGYKLANAFVAEASTPDETNVLSQDATDTCSPASTPLATSSLDGTFVELSGDIDEWDCDVMSGLVAAPGVVTVQASGQDLAASLYGDSSCASGALLDSGVLLAGSGSLGAVVFAAAHSLVVDPFGGANGAYDLAVKHYDVCAVGPADDHGSTRICASPALLGSSGIAGQIANAADDDDDFFTFTVPSLRTVILTSSGSTDTFGSLYNRTGQLLATDNDAGWGANFRIVRSLGAGRYFLRVEGYKQAEGSYSLSLQTILP